MYKHGAVSGKFRILHNAHKEYIIKATLEVEVLHVFIVDDPSIKRYATIKQTQAAIGKILQPLDVKYYIHIAPYTTDMNAWDDYVINVVGHNKVMMYNSKEEYSNIKLPTGYINCDHALSISASEIEKNPLAEHNFRNIASEFTTYLNKKFVISGIDKTGKTQLATKLALMNSTQSLTNVIDNYVNEYLGGERDSFELEDFLEIISLQASEEYLLLSKAKRFLLVDNDPIQLLFVLEQYYSEYAERGILSQNFKQEYPKYHQKITDLCVEYQADAIFILKPSENLISKRKTWDIPFELRMQSHQNLVNMYKKFNKTIHVIGEEDYKSRFNNVNCQIQNILKK